MIRVWCVAFLLIILAGRSGYAQPQTLRFETISTDQGLSGNAVWKIIQDRQGYLWFATFEGLNRYDGYRFTTYTYRPHDTTSISHNIIFSLFADSEGTIWIGTAEGGICKFDRKTERFTTYRPAQPDRIHIPALRAVSAIHEDTDGFLWVGNFINEIRRFNKQTGEFSQKYPLDRGAGRDSLKFAGMYSICKDHAGTLWFGNAQGLHRINLMRGKPGQLSRFSFTHYSHDPTNLNTLSSNAISSIFEDHQGILWIGTEENGLNSFNPKTGRFTRYGHDPGLRSSLSDNRFNFQSIAEDKAGNLWAGTLKGLNKLNPQRTQFTQYLLDPAQPLSNYIRSLLVDKAGILWVGTGAGISKLNPAQKPFTRYDHNPNQSESLSPGYVITICEDHTGKVWLGTTSGGLDLLDPHTGTFRHYQQALPKLSTDNTAIYSILEDRAGTIWIARGKQLLRYNAQQGVFNGSSGSTELDKSLQSTRAITCLYQDRQGLLWIGTYRGMKSYNPVTGAIRHYDYNPNSPDGISDQQINAILEDRRGNLWVGHGSVALTRLDKRSGKFIRYVHNSHDPTSISSNTVESLYEDLQGNIWIGTIAGGLCQFSYKTGRFTTYAEPQGLAGNSIYSILDDQQGNLWLGTNKGIYRFNLVTQSFTQYDASDGVQSNFFVSGHGQAACRGRDGTLYIGGINGFNAFRPEQIKADSTIPPVVITDFRVFDKRLPGKHEAASIELPYDQNFFSFEFAALTYRSVHKNQYAYQLEGVDPVWVHSGTRRTASYTDISPGTYTFRVKGSNSDGIWNEKGTSVTLIIHPPWWRTWWFTALVVAGLFSLVYTGFRYRVEQIQQEAARRNQENQQKAEFSKRLSEMEMQALRAQMNPHFIFNSLNSINRFIMKNQPEAASDYLSKFSKLIRLILQNSASPSVPLDNELQALQLYLEMESLRFEEKFSFRLHCEEDVDVSYLEIPPLLIQPYVENAIWHGLMHKPGSGHIDVRVSYEDGWLLCTVQDDGIGRQRAADLKSKSVTRNKSMGMTITAHRLELLNQVADRDTSVEVVDLVDTQGEACGTRVVLKIPI